MSASRNSSASRAIHGLVRRDNAKAASGHRETEGVSGLMLFPFAESLRDTLRTNLAAFEYAALAPERAGPAAETRGRRDHVWSKARPDSGEAAFLLTRRAATLRGHAGPVGSARRPLRSRRERRRGGLARIARRTRPVGSGRRCARDARRLSDALRAIASRRSLPGRATRRRSRPTPARSPSVHYVPLADIAHPDAVSFVSIAESDRHVVRLRIAGTHVHAPTAADALPVRRDC